MKPLPAPDYALADFDRACWLIAGLVAKVGTIAPAPILTLDLATFVVVRDLVGATSPNLTGASEFVHNGVTIKRGGRPL